MRVIDLTTSEMKYLSGIDMEISIFYKRDKLKVTDTFLSSTDQNFLTLFFSGKKSHIFLTKPCANYIFVRVVAGYKC